MLFWLWRRRAAPASPAGSIRRAWPVGSLPPAGRDGAADRSSPFLLAAGSLRSGRPKRAAGQRRVDRSAALRRRPAAPALPARRPKHFFSCISAPTGGPTSAAIFRSSTRSIRPSPGMGILARSGAGHDRLAVVPDKGRQGIRSRWAPGKPAYRRARSMRRCQHPDRVEERQLQAMLYGAPTGGAPPAPDTEYILVCAIEAAGRPGSRSMPASTSTRRR